MDGSATFSAMASMAETKVNAPLKHQVVQGFMAGAYVIATRAVQLVQAMNFTAYH
jgi:hypothetical protein